MKNAILTIIVLCCTLGLAQTQWEKSIEIPFGPGENQLTLRTEQLQQTKIALGSFPDPRDILIGSDGLFYIPDAVNWRILVYNKAGRLSGTIHVPRKDPGSVPPGLRSIVPGNWMFLAEDRDGHLYVHVTSLEYRSFVLYRFDKDRKRAFEFPFSDRRPGSGDIVSSISVAGRGYVYIPSGPVEILRPNWENPIFKYDNSGRFVGMVDYGIENRQGNVYRTWTTKHGNRYHWELYRFKKPDDPTQPTKMLERSGVLSIPTELTETNLRNAQSFIFCGFDSMMNIYATDGKVTKVFDQSFKLLHEISTPVDDLEKTIGLISRPQNIKISPAGDIYIFGLRTPHGKNISRYAIGEVKFVVLRFK